MKPDDAELGDLIYVTAFGSVTNRKWSRKRQKVKKRRVKGKTVKL